MTTLVRNFQIELLSNGLYHSGGSVDLFQRSAKWIEPSRLPGLACWLEADYRNFSESDGQVRLLNPSEAAIATLALPYTDGVGSFDRDKWARIRTDSSFSLPTDGAYRLDVSGDVQLHRCKLVCQQTAGQLKTVEHIPLMVAADGSTDDLAGIAGTDLFRTTSITFVPTLVNPHGTYDEGDSAKENFIWFKYAAAEWPNLRQLQLEVLCDGFASTQQAALFKLDQGAGTQTQVVGSGVTHTNAGGHLLPTLSATFSPSAMSDGIYAVRFLSGSGIANSFFYKAYLHMIMQGTPGGTLRGNNYFVIGNQHMGQCKSLPAASGASYFEICGFKEGSKADTWIYDDATQDQIIGQGTGVEVTGSHIVLNAAYQKDVLRSADISGHLGANHRYDADDAGATTLQASIVNPFSIDLPSACECDFVKKAESCSGFTKQAEC